MSGEQTPDQNSRVCLALSRRLSDGKHMETLTLAVSSSLEAQKMTRLNFKSNLGKRLMFKAHSVLWRVKVAVRKYEFLEPSF